MKSVFFKSLLFALFVGSLAYFYYSLPDVALLKKQNPRSSALMELRAEEYRKKGSRAPRQQVWVPYGAISEHLKKAILLAEDAAFFNHKGVDVNELKEAIRADWETMSFKRGGSTITMQLAKNLYLDPSKNPLRKVKEIVIAWQLEQALTKRRIFEIYLNVVEFGRNIYGAEAAARHYFGKSAAAVDPLEAATLAALLPSPRSAREKNILTRRNTILTRLSSVGYLSKEEHMRLKQVPLFKKVENEAPLLLADD
jgi:monofunctional biosynthetic peptidoglycan transglycosylase